MKNKKIKKIDPYKHWLKNPIQLDDDEISKNIIADSSGFIIRDYRFQPKILPDDISNYKVDDKIHTHPDDIQLFYALNLRNRRKALSKLKKYKSKRKESNKGEMIIDLKKYMLIVKMINNTIYMMTSLEMIVFTLFKNY